MSVIVPARNEATVIDATLRALGAGTDNGLEIIVACNGCTDDTAARARRHGAEVIELEQGSKTAALNAADRVARHFPRFYVDADIAVEARDLQHAARAFDGRIHAVSPEMRPVTTGRPWAVRAFYDVWTDLPYCKTLIGSGVFGLDAEARSRFEAFPDIIADDLFARLQVAPDERKVVPGCSFPLETPRTVRSLIKVKTRAHLGQRELRSLRPDLFKNEDARHGNALLRLACSVPRWPSIMVYLVVRLSARMRALGQRNNDGPRGWERDETSR